MVCLLLVVALEISYDNVLKVTTLSIDIGCVFYGCVVQVDSPKAAMCEMQGVSCRKRPICGYSPCILLCGPPITTHGCVWLLVLKKSPQWWLQMAVCMKENTFLERDGLRESMAWLFFFNDAVACCPWNHVCGFFHESFCCVIFKDAALMEILIWTLPLQNPLSCPPMVIIPWSLYGVTCSSPTSRVVFNCLLIS